MVTGDRESPSCNLTNTKPAVALQPKQSSNASIFNLQVLPVLPQTLDILKFLLQWFLSTRKTSKSSVEQLLWKLAAFLHSCGLLNVLLVLLYQLLVVGSSMLGQKLSCLASLRLQLTQLRCHQFPSQSYIHNLTTEWHYKQSITPELKKINSNCSTKITNISTLKTTSLKKPTPQFPSRCL